MAGIMNSHTMVTPWSVNIRLYARCPMTVRPGVSSSMRSASANTPPRKKKLSVSPRNISPMRLWSCVVSHDHRVRPSVR